MHRPATNHIHRTICLMLIYPWTTVEPSGPLWLLCQGTGTTDQANYVKLGSKQFSPMLLHSTLVSQQPIIKHKMTGMEGTRGKPECLPPPSRGRDCPVAMPHNRSSGLLQKIELFMGCSVGFKYARNALVAGALPWTPLGASSRRSPRPLSRLGRGTPVPMPHPPLHLDSRTFSASILVLPPLDKPLDDNDMLYSHLAVFNR